MSVEKKNYIYRVKGNIDVCIPVKNMFVQHITLYLLNTDGALTWGKKESYSFVI